ncbi:mercury methylation corrinoid protein HgcA [Planctomycetota bacterium]
MMDSPCCLGGKPREDTCCPEPSAPPADVPGAEQPFVSGVQATPVGPVPAVTSRLCWCDHWGTFKARWGVHRMDYRVHPGLYALGRPDRDSRVLVTANYKMTFDHLRRALPGRDAWILVLDTSGVNVWCAAGKGTFSTEELTARVKSSRLAEVVRHRELILPQLSAPGVAGYAVKRGCGFKALFGPIRAEDLPSFLDGGMRATPAMRRKSFTIGERVVLIPVELVSVLKATVVLAPALFFLGGLGWPGDYWENAWAHGGYALLGLFAAILAGAVLTPVLLPWLPGRAFSVKGAALGVLAATALALLAPGPGGWATHLEVAAWWILAPALASFIAMNFTGAATFTSLSGVKKEMRWALPMQAGGGLVGLGMLLGTRFLA